MSFLQLMASEQPFYILNLLDLSFLNTYNFEKETLLLSMYPIVHFYECMFICVCMCTRHLNCNSGIQVLSNSIKVHLNLEQIDITKMCPASHFQQSAFIYLILVLAKRWSCPNKRFANFIKVGSHKCFAMFSMPLIPRRVPVILI